MARRARTLLCMMIAALIVLEATPSLPNAPAPRVAEGHCEIAATVEPVVLVATPAERGTGPSDGLSLERTGLGGFTLVRTVNASLDAAAGALRRANERRRTGAAWVRALQQRARSPGDPDPL